MTYEEALLYIHSTIRKGAVPGLGRIRELMERLGNPQRQLSYVHITGTNGKGSTAAMTASVLRAAGYRVGLYTSPFLWRFNERMNVDGRDIADEELAQVTELVKPAAQALSDPPTEFELVTAIALCWFARKQCDIVVLEVGMGGKNDATNVIPAPEVAVLCNIGLDHTAQLGTTLAAIAENKSGILKPGCQGVLYPNSPDVETVVTAVCQEQGIPLHIADFSQIHVKNSDFSGQILDYKGYSGLRLPLLGSHQARNCAVVLETLEALRQQGWNIPEEAVYKGIANTVWPGRFELLRREPIFIVDGGHNPQCLAALAENVKTYLDGREIIALTGVMADKDYLDMYKDMVPLVSQFVTVTPDNPRSLDAESLADYLRQLGTPAQAAGSVEEGVQKALALAGTDGAVLAFGSLYMTGPIRQAVKSMAS